MSHQELKQSLEADRMTSTWGAVGDVLAPHIERETLIIVDRSIALLDAAVALATDDASSVSEWLAADALKKLSATGFAEYQADGEMELVIVQPFVLVRPLTEP